MNLTIEQLKKIIKEELEDMVGGPIYGNMPSVDPMVKMADDILSASRTANYKKIKNKAESHARNYFLEMSDLGKSGSSSMYYVALKDLGDALHNYINTGGKDLNRLIKAAVHVKNVYTPDNQMPLTDDDPDF
tara:strand:+ start:853 stop:1248 length:396 start_codon:yes stop_codon:yes gene_type:complete